MTPELRSEIKKQLTHDEGKRFKAYVCSAGKLTIGIGRNLEDVGISEDTVSQMFDEDLEKCIKHGEKIFPHHWNTFSNLRKAGIINMIFNLGAVGFSQFKMMIEAIKVNDRDGIRKHGSASLWAKQVKGRAQRVLSLIADEIDIYPTTEGTK
jgi:lysozyme